jgi:hypothetical protein
MAGDRPEKPEDLDLIVWYDLSPMRPDAYMAQNGYRWHEAVMLRSAYERGQRDAHDEKAAYDKLLTMEPQA